LCACCSRYGLVSRASRFSLTGWLRASALEGQVADGGGDDALADAHADGGARLGVLAAHQAEGQRPPAGSEIVAGDAPIGAVTSATLSLGLGRPLALGLVRRQHAEPGTAVGVRIGERVVPATVSDLPFKR